MAISLRFMVMLTWLMLPKEVCIMRHLTNVLLGRGTPIELHLEVRVESVFFVNT